MGATKAEEGLLLTLLETGDVMKFTMTVIREVDIPDLPESLMALIGERGGVVNTFIVPCGLEVTPQFYELYVEIVAPLELLARGRSTISYWSAIYNHPEWDESRMNWDTPWFSSDSTDGEEPCRLWIEAMKAKYPGVVVEDEEL